MKGRGLLHFDDQRAILRRAAQQLGQMRMVARSLGGAAEAAGDGQEVRGVDVDADPVSYTHLDVYKRQVEVRSLVRRRLFFHTLS